MAKSSVVCHECGLQQELNKAKNAATVRCVRCGCVLHRSVKPAFDRALALTIAGVILFAVANLLPFLGIDINGEIRQTTLITGVIKLYQQGKWILSLVVLFTSVIVPGLQLCLLLYILLPIYFSRLPYDLAGTFKFTNQLAAWSMMDVFLLGVLVSVVKLSDFGSILVGPAFVAFILLIFVLAAIQVTIDKERIWSMVRVKKSYDSVSLSSELITCPTCHFSMPQPMARDSQIKCPRCLTVVHYRKPFSLQRTWALLIAAMICYVPANLLPVMHTTSLGAVQDDTILSGVVYLYSHGMWPLALIVFTASVFIPLLKVLILAVLLLSVQQRSQKAARDRTKLYRITEVIGRWSMVDVFVVTVLVALVQMGSLATIGAGWGAVFFSAVVILSMLAAMSFDSRLMWDCVKE